MFKKLEKDLAFMGYHRAPPQNRILITKNTSEFKLEDIKQSCWQCQNFKRKFHTVLEFFSWESDINTPSF